MKEKAQKVLKYIFRSWEDEPTEVDRRLRILPPFFYETLSWLIFLSLAYKLGEYLLEILK
jgi:hypothetical protein